MSKFTNKLRTGIKHVRNQLSFSKCRYVVNNKYNPILNNTRKKCIESNKVMCNLVTRKKSKKHKNKINKKCNKK